MDERIIVQKNFNLNNESMDNRLFKMQNEIWKRVHKVLNIEGIA